MTEKKIAYAFKKIRTTKEKGYILEALLRNYHLNLDLINYILSACAENYLAKDKKAKAIFHHFLKEVAVNPKLKSVLNKKNLKSLKPWLGKMELFFKTLKVRQPTNVKSLQLETEQISGILNISAAKLLAQNKK